MDFSQILLLIFLLIFIFFPLLARIFSPKRPTKPPPFKEEEDGERETPHRKLILAKPKAHEFDFHSSLEGFKRTSEIEERHLESSVHPDFKDQVVGADLQEKKAFAHKKRARPKIQISKSSLKQMVLFAEVFKNPKWKDDESAR